MLKDANKVYSDAELPLSGEPPSFQKLSMIVGELFGERLKRYYEAYERYDRAKNKFRILPSEGC